MAAGLPTASKVKQSRDMSAHSGMRAEPPARERYEI